MGTSIKADLRQITPAMAIELLRANTGNRPLNPRVVDRYAADMTAGAWQTNGEPIIVGSDNRLLDGQHRLHAVIKADAPIAALLITGIDPEAQRTIDTGFKRGNADHLAMLGIKNASKTAATCRLLYAWEEGRPLGNAPSRSPSVHEMLAVMGRWNCLDEGVRLSALCAGNRHGVHPSTLCLFLTLACSADEGNGNVLTFVRQFATGAGLDVGHPVLHLRNHLTGQLARSIRVGKNQHLAWLTQAWTAVFEDRSRRRYMKTSPLTQFPGLVGRTQGLK